MSGFFYVLSLWNCYLGRVSQLGVAEIFVTKHIDKVTENAGNEPFYKQGQNESDAEYGEKIAGITACMHNSGSNAKRCKSQKGLDYWYTKRPNGFLAKWDAVKNLTAKEACAL